MEARPWLHRYVLRRDLLCKVRARVDAARRRLGRNELDDAARLLGHRQVHTVVDCGAHVGDETARFLRDFPDAVVHAFEPTASTHEALERHLGDEPRAILHRAVVVEGAEVAALDGAGGLLADDRVDLVAVEVRVQPDFIGGPLLADVVRRLEVEDHRLFGVHDFTESEIGESLWGNARFPCSSMRRELERVHGVDACGVAD